MKRRNGILSPRLLLHLLLLRPLLRLIFGVNARGREHLYGLDRFILAANHNSHLDTLLLYSILPARRILRVHPVAAKDYFARAPRVFRLMERLFEPIWVDREDQPGAALAEMGRRLDEGDSILIFPEGTRGEPGVMQDFKAGVGRLVAAHPDVPVVPVFILGPERSLPKSAPFPLPLWNQLVLGPPLRWTGTPRDVTRSLTDSIAGLARAETARRQRRKAPRRRTRTVAVLGIDGSGKSTLSRSLACALSEGASACLVSDTLQVLSCGEPHDMQPLLKEKLRVWLGRQAKQAGSLARYKIPKLGEMLLRDRLLDEAERWYGPDWLVLDGSTLLNLTAWSVLYREECFDEGFCRRALGILSGREKLRRGDPLLAQFGELRTMQRLRLTRLHVPDVVIMLDVRAETAMARIESRGEEKQVHETAEKLARLREAYLMVCDVVKRDWGLPLLRLEGERDRASVEAEVLAFVRATKGGDDE